MPKEATINQPAKAGTTNGNNAPAASEEITADQLAQQLAEMRQGTGTGEENENDLNGAESANTEAEAGGENEAALNGEGQADAGVQQEGTEGTEGTEAGEQEQEQDQEQEGDLPAETQERINKRIGKEVAKRKALEEENARLKAELAQKTPPHPDPLPQGVEGDDLAANGAGASGGTGFERQMQGELQQAEALLEWAQRNPDGGTVRGNDGKEYTFSPEQAQAIQRKAIKDVTRLTVKLENFQQEKGRNDQVLTQAARAEYPKMFTKGTPENKLALKLLADFPELGSLPGGRLALGDIVSKTMERIAKGASARDTAAHSAGAAPNGNATNGSKKPSPRPTKIPAVNGSAPGNRAASSRQTQPTYADADTVEKLAKSFASKRAGR